MRILFCIIALLAGEISFAQNKVTGVVSDMSGTPVDAAIVKITVDKAVVTYTMTGSDGRYELPFKVEARQVTLSVESMGYESANRLISNTTQVCNVVLKEKITVLKEVVVKAPAIYQRGDTLSYNLSSYIGHGDYTLKDAMKKLPGIDVTESGSIKYLGKEISNFYIDGLDLLGGKYNIATSNIPASYVNSVQVLNNHQAVKMDEDMFSDDVAVNINLNNRARFKPMGTYETSVGYGKDWLYQASGAGMLFRTGFQAIATLKAGNIFRFATGEDTYHFGNTQDQSYAIKLMGDLSASNPPVDVDRYASPTDGLFTLNLLKKMTDYAILRGNVGYSYSKSDYEYGLQRIYYDGEEDISISQQFSPQSTLHKPNFSLEYKYNSPKNYIKNTCSGFFSILKSELPTMENERMSMQQQSLRDFNLENDFSIRWRRGKLRWSVSSFWQFRNTPTARLTIKDEETADVIQNAHSTTLLTKNILSAVYEHHNSRFYFPLLLNWSADKVQTSLQTDMKNPGNDMKGGKLSIAFAPQYEYTHPQRKYVFRAELPLRGDYINYRDHIQKEKHGFWYFSACPGLYLNYTISARSVFRTRVSLSRTFGDILDFLTTPVQTDLTTQKISSGILSDNKKWLANLHYDYKIPLEMWFVNADVMYQRDDNNLLLSQEVTSNLIQSGYSFMPNTSDNITGQLGITKQIESIKTKVSLKGSYLWRQQMTAQNERLIKSTWQSVSLSPVLTSQPCKYVELDYSGFFSKTYLDYESVKKNYWSQIHQIVLKILPVQSFQIMAKSDIIKKEITTDISKTMTLLDFGLSYKHKAMRLELNLRNALNQQSYSYTIYNSINTYTYDYRLRGRELVFSFILTR